MARKQQNNGPAFQEFDRRVRKLTAIGWDRQRAVASVAAKDPELHRQMVAETSTGTDPRVLQAVANGAESMVAPVQRSTSGQAKQTTAKPVAGTATRQPATKASTATAAPVAPAAATPAVPVVVVAPLPPTAVDANPQRVGRFNYDPNFSPYNVIPW